MAMAEALARTALYTLHRECGARFVPFAGTEMPLHFPPGILAEHRHCRKQAALFDVSHMGQIRVAGPEAARALESVTPAGLLELAPGRMRYTLLTNDAGGISDDVMIVRTNADFLLIVNAARKADDFTYLRERIGTRAELAALDERALLALQGPLSAEVLGRSAPACRHLAFLEAARCDVAGADGLVMRSGYTGEDGFEIALPAGAAEAVARRLLAEPETMPAGLGARDTLRLEAGLCLYGHDIDESTTIVEADLAWTVSERRRTQGGFPGAAVLQRQLASGAGRKRVGIRLLGRAIAREHAAVVDAGGHIVGAVTSGGFGPTVGGPIAMGYVASAQAAIGTALGVVVRDAREPAAVAALPFVPHRYHHPPFAKPAARPA